MYIRREGSMLHLYDHGSLNGTWVNGQQIGPEGVLLRAGDQVKIGASEFALEL
jgi:pSer/pThr/pTyr-binding forkhead associated (FHA) protein